jgi:hypothetical protein
VLDRSNRQPVSQVEIVVQGTDLRAVTDTLGRFRFAQVQAGLRVLVVQHLAYGQHSDSVAVRAGEDVRLEILISSRAIQLAPVLVEVRTELEQRRRTTGHGMNEILQPEIDEAAQRGLNLGELLRDGMPGLRVRPVSQREAISSFGPTYCIEYRGGASLRGGCNEVSVYLDGVQISAPANLYSTLPLRQIERLEVLSPGEAGAQYGLMGGAGVLLIETRQGPRPVERAMREDRSISGFDWSGEQQAYRWTRVAFSSILANALGVGLGMLVADPCLNINRDGPPIRISCNPAIAVGASMVTLALPGAAGGLAARWAGGTDRSQGRFAPSAVLGTLTVAAGYLMYVQGDSDRSKTMQNAGVVVLTVGTPIVTTLSDRVFRVLR